MLQTKHDPAVGRTFLLEGMQCLCMDCRVVVEAAVPVFDVETADEAIRIAISKTGEMLNPDLNYVEINMASAPPRRERSFPAFIAADEALVALELEMTVFNVEREEHASRIARKEIGQLLENIPLEVMHVEVLDDDEDANDSADEETTASDDESTTTNSTGDADENDTTEDDADDEILPEFEDLVE